MSWWSYGKGLHRAPRSVQGPTPAGSFAPAGGQVSQRPDQGSNPPQSVVAPTQAAGTLRARTVIVFGSGGGVFIYSGAPAAGTLIATITGAGGTDPYGNVYQEGITSYPGGGSGTSVYSQLLAGGVELNESTFATAAALTTSGSAGVSATLQVISPTGTEVGATRTELLLSDSGGTGSLQVVSGADGNTYDTERLSLVVASNFPVNSATPGTITGLSAAVAAGSYRVQGMVNFATGGSATGILLGFSGPATSACRISTRWQTATSFGGDINTGVNSREQTSIGTNASPTLTVGTAYEFTFTGYVTFSAAGTFAAVAAEAVSGQSSTVGATSFLDLMPVG